MLELLQGVPVMAMFLDHAGATNEYNLQAALAKQGLQQGSYVAFSRAPGFHTTLLKLELLQESSVSSVDTDKIYLDWDIDASTWLGVLSASILPGTASQTLLCTCCCRGIGRHSWCRWC